MTDRGGLFFFLGACSTGAILLLLPATPTAMRAKRRFSGTSKSGSLEEALGHAIASAERSAGHADALVTWRLDSVSGRSGGIAGLRELKVVIEATVA
jgi:hypothetical protein